MSAETRPLPPNPRPHPPLPRSYKGRFPFKTGAPSFVYPDGYAANVRLLGPCVDAVELLFFESPSAAQAADLRPEIERLEDLGHTHGLTYNVHLPTDIPLCAPDATARRSATRALKRVIDLAAPLRPTTHTLHLPCDTTTGREAPATWRRTVAAGLDQLLSSGVPPGKLSLETLDYPVAWVADTAREFDLRICLDVGHLLFHGRDLPAVFETCAARTTMVHLHAVDGGRDHQALDRMPPATLASVAAHLTQLGAEVSLEVFSHPALKASLQALAGVLAGK